MELNAAKITADFELDEDIVRNLNTLYSTRAGTMPLDRDFGIKGDFVGETLPIYQNQYAVEVMMKTEKYEPRVVVRQVKFETSEDGEITPIILLEKPMGG
ncbi:MAG: GPW/gp25 family protein [Lachnospiraceae bacterium]|nr:GPW/gp25 family protein [Lachnospiraceae bacterium]